MWWLPFIGIPFVVYGFAKARWKHDITWTEAGLMYIVSGIVALIIYFVGGQMFFQSSEVWNGEIIAKRAVTYPCGSRKSHDYGCEHYWTYSCDPRLISYTDANGHLQTRTEYDTCYRYEYDWEKNWFLDSNIDRIITVPRIDDQGAQEPPEWTRIPLGWPVSDVRSYENYIKPSASLFRTDVEAVIEPFRDQIPVYPLFRGRDAFTKDHPLPYYIDRVLIAGDVTLNEPLSEWNFALADTVKDLGPKKEANVILVLTSNPDPIFVEAIRHAWRGAEKNDIVIGIGLAENLHIEWVDTFSWSKNNMVEIALREEIIALGTLDLKPLMTVIHDSIDTYFERRSMEEFEYLKGEAGPSLTFLLIGSLIASAISFGLVYMAVRDNIFTDDWLFGSSK